MSSLAIYQEKIRFERRTQQLALIKPMVEKIRRKMPRIGTRKIYYLLQEDFKKAQIKIGRDTLFAYLRSEHMLNKPVKNYTKTTHSKHWLKKHPNLMKEVKAKRPEEYFVSDITYIKSSQRTHYLSLVSDAYSRKIMGYQLNDYIMAADNVVKALNMAVRQRRTSLPLVHHSDRGLQYCSASYQKSLAKNNIQPSTTDGYDCYQNAMAERINGMLKEEFLINQYNNKKELELIVKESINIYNNERPHLNLNIKTPNFIYQKTCEELSTGSYNIN